MAKAVDGPNMKPLASTPIHIQALACKKIDFFLYWVKNNDDRKKKQKKKNKQRRFTSNKRDMHVFVAINKDINCMFKGLVIQQQRCYVLKHNPCPRETKRLLSENCNNRKRACKKRQVSRETKQRKMFSKTFLGEIRNNSNSCWYSFKPWISFEPVLRRKHCFSTFQSKSVWVIYSISLSLFLSWWVNEIIQSGEGY